MKLIDSEELEALEAVKYHMIVPLNHVDSDEQRTIFVDMDGVICDFYGHFVKLHGIHPKNDKMTDEDFWYVFNRNPHGFFYDLKPVHGYLEFLAFVMRHAEAYGYNVKFLTALSPHNAQTFEEQLTDKINWLKDNVYSFGMVIPMGFVEQASEKQVFAKYGQILIDDTEINIKQWRDAKGTAIHHRDFTSSMTDLIASLQVIHERRLEP